MQTGTLAPSVVSEYIPVSGEGDGGQSDGSGMTYIYVTFIHDTACFAGQAHTSAAAAAAVAIRSSHLSFVADVDLLVTYQQLGYQLWLLTRFKSLEVTHS